MVTNHYSVMFSSRLDRDKVLVFISGTTPHEKEGDLVELIKVAHAQDEKNHIRVVTLGIGKIGMQIIRLRVLLRTHDISI